jgi:hypothetical protein
MVKQSFVIKGKAKPVFDLIASKARQEKAEENVKRELAACRCPFQAGCQKVAERRGMTDARD